MGLQGDIVYVNDDTISSLVEEKTVFHEETQTTTQVKHSSENDTDLSSQQPTSHAYSDPNFLSNLYITVMNMRNTNSQVKPPLLWLPTAETLNL